MKKLLALVMALVMSMSLVTISNAAFADADDIEHTEAVEVMSAIGVIDGTDGNKFDPDGSLTRAQAAKIICTMLLGDAAENLNLKSSFSDVSGWAESYIAYCAEQGIVSGVGDNKFDPNGKLTGYQFAKMLLVALGYKAENEGFNTSAWEVNVAKFVVTAGLNKDIKSVALSAVITREQAAQMAFNALKATMVEYTNGTKVETTDGTKVEVNATRYYVGNNAEPVIESYSNLQTPYTQFCEQYFSKLVLNTNGSTDTGRPANNWAYEGKTIGDYAKTPIVTYSADLDTTSGKKVVKADLKGYEVTAALSTTYGITQGGVQEDVDSDAVAGVTDYGKLVEVYATDNVITDVVEISYELATISKVNAKDKEVTVKYGTYKTTVNEIDDLYDFFSKLEKDDLVVITGDNLGADDAKIYEAYEPTKITGKLTKYDDTNNKYTLGGEVYNVSENGTDDDIDSDSDLNQIRVLYLDRFGYIMKTDEVDSTDAYALVLNASAQVNRGNYDYAVQLLKADGTKEWVDVAEIDGNIVADDEVTTSDVNSLVNNFVSYEKGDKGYKLDSCTTKTDDDVDGTITKGDSDVITWTGSNKTVFLLKNSDGSYTVYNGIKNVPTITISYSGTSGDENAFILDDSGFAPMVVVNKFSTTAATDQVYIFNATVQASGKDGSTVLKTYKAIVNGEIDTIEVGDSTFNGSPAAGLYLDNGYTKGYIGTVSSAVSTSENTDKSGSTDVYTYGGTFEIDDVKLKDGILTFVDGTNSVANAVAVTDDFQAFLIDDDNAKADTLSLDKDSTMTDLGDAFASGDYAIVVFDEDGYARTLYVVISDSLA